MIVLSGGWSCVAAAARWFALIRGAARSSRSGRVATIGGSIIIIIIIILLIIMIMKIMIIVICIKF